MRRLFFFVLAGALVGFVPPKVKLERRTRGVSVTITASGQMFDLINTTDCIPWPTEEMKTLGGQSGWAGWVPHNGDTGEGLARTRHCFSDVNVVFVRIGTHYVAIGEPGIQFNDGRLEDLPVLTKP